MVIWKKIFQYSLLKVFVIWLFQFFTCFWYHREREICGWANGSGRLSILRDLICLGGTWNFSRYYTQNRYFRGCQTEFFISPIKIESSSTKVWKASSVVSTFFFFLKLEHERRRDFNNIISLFKLGCIDHYSRGCLSLGLSLYIPGRLHSVEPLKCLLQRGGSS